MTGDARKVLDEASLRFINAAMDLARRLEATKDISVLAPDERKLVVAFEYLKNSTKGMPHVQTS